MSEEKIIGYTTGVYDLFHIGHLNLLKNAKGMCDYLVVGVTVDELVAYKGKHAMIPFEDRIEIVRSCKYVDAAVPQYDMDKLTACKKLGAKMLFVGDDWYGTDKWKEYEKKFAAEGIKIVYFPYTKGISSTKITEALKQVRSYGITDLEIDAARLLPKNLFDRRRIRGVLKEIREGDLGISCIYRFMNFGYRPERRQTSESDSPAQLASDHEEDRSALKSGSWGGTQQLQKKQPDDERKKAAFVYN